jgi:hypothetical protein
MKLLINSEEFKELTSNALLVFYKDNLFKLHLAKNGRSNIDFLIVELDESVTSTVALEKNIGVTPPKEIEELYAEYMKEFPTNGNKYLGIPGEGENFRTGKKDKIKNSLKLRLKEGYKAEDIVLAVKYNFWFKARECKKSGNYDNLKYVKRAESWINDTASLAAMIERLKASEDFKKEMNLTKNGEQGNEGTTHYRAKLL